MMIVCADDHRVMLHGLMAMVSEILPEAQVQGFTKSDAALSYINKNGCDVLLCEIEMYSKKGMLLAEEVKRINPNVNIIFVTVCDEKEHAREVLKLKPSGYLTKPATKGQLFEELAHLRYPVRGELAVI